MIRKKSLFPKDLSNWQEVVIDFVTDMVIIFLLVFLVIRPFVISPFQVKQNSMEPNVHDSEYILVSKLPYNSILGWKEYSHGDIVVFRPPTNPETYLIKRVIGIPGDTVRIEGGFVWRKDQATGEFKQLDESYLSEINRTNTCLIPSGVACSPEAKKERVEFVVPSGSYFVLGDNRVASRDARSCFVSRCVSESEHYLLKSRLEGRAWAVFFPIRGVRTLEHIAN